MGNECKWTHESAFRYPKGHVIFQFSCFNILQSWHEKIDVKSSVLPKMIKFLKSESHLLSGIYPRILPLVAAIPQEDLEDFYAEILASIKSGLKTFVISTRGIPKGLPGGTSSLQSGGSACVMAYFEVALHCLKNSRIHSPIFDQVRNDKKIPYANKIQFVFKDFRVDTKST